MNRNYRISTYPSNFLPEGLIEGSSGGDDLGEASGPREGATKNDTGANIGDTMKSLRPPLVALDAEPWHSGCIVHEQPNLLLKRQPSDQVSHSHVYRHRRPAKLQAPRHPVLRVACERRARFNPTKRNAYKNGDEGENLQPIFVSHKWEEER